jgi:ABC-type multidrug transport system ATPase subunit
VSEPALRTEHLTRRYGTLTAVSNLNLRVEQGEIYGFLGPNGAGKTTSLLMVLGIIPPTEGEIYLWDRRLRDDPVTLKRRVGVVGEQDHFHEHLTAEEYLRFFAEIYDVPQPRTRIGALLDRLGLFEFRSIRAREYSRGMKQKLSLARALLHAPGLLVLDEPTAGLDPHGIVDVRTLLEECNRDGMTIVISSHLLSEVERSAHRVGILHHGRLVRQDTIAGLRAMRRPGAEVEIQLQEPLPGVEAALASLPFVRHVMSAGDRVSVTLDGDSDGRAALARMIAAHGGLIVGMRTREPSLEDAFLTLTERDVEQWGT